MHDMIKTLSIALEPHPVNEWNESIKQAYYVVLKHYLDRVEKDKLEITVRFEVYKAMLKLDLESIQLEYELARKQIKKRYYIELKGQIKCKAMYPKYILLMDLLWMTQGQLPEGLHLQFISEYGYSKSDVRCIENIWHLIENNYVSQAKIYFNECMKYQKYKEIRYYVEQLKNQEKQKQKKDVNVAVIATMSAGKSTFMNTITQLDIFPTQNQACTAKITTCQYNRYIDHTVGCAYKKDGTIMYSGLINEIQMKEWNKDETITSIYLEGNIPWISEESKYNVSFFDTPGTNYSQDMTHQKITLDFIKQNKMDIILYVINATQIATEDDKFLLQTVAKSIKEKDTQMIFLLNKVDQFDLEGQDNLEDTIEGLNKYIQECEIYNYKLIPISAYGAKLFQWSKQKRQLGRKEKRDRDELIDLFRESIYDLRNYYECNRERSSRISELDEVIERTNIPAVQQSLQQRLVPQR